MEKLLNFHCQIHLLYLLPSASETTGISEGHL